MDPTFRFRRAIPKYLGGNYFMGGNRQGRKEENTNSRRDGSIDLSMCPRAGFTEGGQMDQGSFFCSGHPARKLSLRINQHCCIYRGVFAFFHGKGKRVCLRISWQLGEALYLLQVGVYVGVPGRKHVYRRPDLDDVSALGQERQVKIPHLYCGAGWGGVGCGVVLGGSGEEIKQPRKKG